MNARKMAIGGLMAMVLGLAMIQTIQAGPHGPVPPQARGSWCTFEIRFQLTHVRTGQVWNQGFTYTRYYDRFGTLVNDNERLQIINWLNNEAHNGWRQTWSSGGSPIASGTW